MLFLSVIIVSMSKDKKVWEEGQGVNQESAELAQQGVNKSGLENIREAAKNIRDLFSGSARANTAKENEVRKNSGGYYKN